MQQETCRCGSKSHKRTSNSKCVLNRGIFKHMMEFPYARISPSTNSDGSISNLRHSILLNARKKSLKKHGGFGEKYQDLLAATKNILEDLQAAENVERLYFQQDIRISQVQSLNVQQPTDIHEETTVNQTISILVDDDDDVRSIWNENNSISNNSDANDDIIVIDEDEEEESVKFDDEEENTNSSSCSLCLSPALGSISFFSRCHHGFHTNCANAYKKSCEEKKQALTCPLCRSKGTIHLLYIQNC